MDCGRIKLLSQEVLQIRGIPLKTPINACASYSDTVLDKISLKTQEGYKTHAKRTFAICSSVGKGRRLCKHLNRTQLDLSDTLTDPNRSITVLSTAPNAQSRTIVPRGDRLLLNPRAGFSASSQVIFITSGSRLRTGEGGRYITIERLRAKCCQTQWWSFRFWRKRVRSRSIRSTTARNYDSKWKRRNWGGREGNGRVWRSLSLKSWETQT